MVRFKRKDGTPYYSLLSLTPIVLDGRPCWQALVEDITERRQLEAERLERESLRRSRRRVLGAQETVRREIARHIHGSVQSKLIVAMSRAQQLAENAPSQRLASDLIDLGKILSGIIDDDLELIARRLYPTILGRGIAPAIQSLGDTFGTVLHLEMQLSEDLSQGERTNAVQLSENVKLATYRIAENALTNVVEHADTDTATLALELRPAHRLSLTIRDHGEGFDTEEASGGLGLRTMEDYADAVDGELTIQSWPGGGHRSASRLADQPIACKLPGTPAPSDATCAGHPGRRDIIAHNSALPFDAQSVSSTTAPS